MIEHVQGEAYWSDFTADEDGVSWGANFEYDGDFCLVNFACWGAPKGMTYEKFESEVKKFFEENRCGFQDDVDEAFAKLIKDNGWGEVDDYAEGANA